MKKLLSIIVCGVLVGTGVAGCQDTEKDERACEEQLFFETFEKKVYKVLNDSSEAELSLLKAGQYFGINDEMCRPPLVNDEETRARLNQDLAKESQVLVTTFFAGPLYQMIENYIQKFVTLTLNGLTLDSENGGSFDKKEILKLQELDCYYPHAYALNFSWQYLYDKGNPIGIIGKLRQVKGLALRQINEVVYKRVYKVMVDVACEYVFLFKSIEKRRFVTKNNQFDHHQLLQDQQKKGKDALVPPANVVTIDVDVEPHSFFRGSVKFLCDERSIMSHLGAAGYAFDVAESAYEKHKDDSVAVHAPTVTSSGGYARYWFFTVPDYADLRALSLEPFQVTDFVINRFDGVIDSDAQKFLNQEKPVVDEEQFNEKE